MRKTEEDRDASQRKKRVRGFTTKDMAYEGCSHGVYEQAKDFNSRVQKYLIRR